MKNGKYSNKKGLNMKPLALLLALALVVGGVVGGTIAWLTATTKEVENTFTVGNIDIKLEEDGATTADGETVAKKGYHFVPGDKLVKEPKVTVLKKSEDCYLFVKVTVENNIAGTGENQVNPVINFAMEDGWIFYPVNSSDSAPTEFKNGTYYYYRTVTKNDDNDQLFYIIDGGKINNVDNNGQVTVSADVEKGMVPGLLENPPKLSFDAAAIQVANIEAKDGKTPLQVAFGLVQWN